MAFDLIIPGWLPPTFDGDMSSTSYGLVATGEFSLSNPSVSSSSSCFPTIPPPSPSQPVAIAQTHQLQAGRFTSLLSRSIAAAKAIGLAYPVVPAAPVYTATSTWQTVTVSRHRIPLGQMSCPVMVSAPELASLGTAPSNVGEAEPVMRHFSLKPSSKSRLFNPEINQSLKPLPLYPTVDSPSPVECVVSTPEFVDVEGSVLRISIRLRARKSPMPRAPGGQNTCGLSQGITPPGSPPTDGAVDQEEAIVSDYFSPPQNAHTDMGHEAPDIAGAIIDQDIEPSYYEQHAPASTRMLELGMEVEESERYW